MFTGLELPNTYEVHFSKTDSPAIQVLGGADGVDVPDSLLLTSGILHGWVYVHTEQDDGWTKREFVLTVLNRPSINGSEPTPVEQSIIEQAIAELNAAVERVESIALYNISIESIDADTKRLAITEPEEE